MAALATERRRRALTGPVAGLIAGAISCALAAGAAAEPATVGDLARWFEASRAFEQGDASANAHRAGRFDGYLGGLAEALAARRAICLPGCFCTIRERLVADLERRFADPAFDPALPAEAWLAERLVEVAPCVRP